LLGQPSCRFDPISVFLVNFVGSPGLRRFGFPDCLEVGWRPAWSAAPSLHHIVVVCFFLAIGGRPSGNGPDLTWPAAAKRRLNRGPPAAATAPAPQKQDPSGSKSQMTQRLYRLFQGNETWDGLVVRKPLVSSFQLNLLSGVATLSSLPSLTLFLYPTLL